MHSTYEKLNTFEIHPDWRSTRMAGRTPSFIVVGLVIIMFLLGVFYMSCSSKNTELRTSLEQFEERIRALTLKNSDADKKYENLLTRQRELEEEKLAVEKQMQKKDSEVNDLNTKLNEKVAELQSINSDKKVADEQIKEYKSQGDTLAAKNSLIEKLQQQLNEQKQTHEEEINKLKKEFETLKTNPAAQNNQFPPTNESKSTFLIPPGRFRPLETNNYTTRSLAALFQEPLNQLNNLTKEVKAQIVSESGNFKDKVLGAFGFNRTVSTTTVVNQEQEQEEGQQQKQQQREGQNVPAPPLADNAQRRQQPGHVESAQAAPQLDNDKEVAAANRAQYQNNFHRSSNNRNSKLSDLEEVDDEEQLNRDNARDNFAQNNPSFGRSNRKNYRINDRGNFLPNRKDFPRRQRIDNGEELGANENQDDFRHLRKRNTV